LTSVSEIPPAEAARLLHDLTMIVARACEVLRDVSPENVAQRVKADDSPVTAADEASQAVIVEGLARVLPGVPVVSEELAGHNR
jgi:3'(2'), 5'-bisphosphate nucleotidase